MLKAAVIFLVFGSLAFIGFPLVSTAMLAICLVVSSRRFLLLVAGLTVAGVLVLGSGVFSDLELLNSAHLTVVAALAIGFAGKKTLLEGVPVFWVSMARPVFFFLSLLAIGGMLVRPYPAYDCAMWAALFTAIYAGTKPALSWSIIRGRMANAGLLACAVLFSVLLLELGCRMFSPLPPPTMGMFESDPRYVFLSRPGGEAVFQVAVEKDLRRPVKHFISAQGFRDRIFTPKEPNEYRILMLGDSHTQGHAVAPEDSIPKQLEDLLRQEELPKKASVINGGLCAAGPLQELGMLRTRGLLLEPDLVILQLFPANDIENSLAVIGKRMRAYEPLTQGMLMHLRRQSESRQLRLELWFNGHSSFYRLLLHVSRQQNLILKGLQRLRGVPKVEFERPEPAEDRNCMIEADLKEWYPELSEGMDLMKRDITEIVRECDAHKLPLLCYCMPQYTDVIDSLWTASVGGPDRLSLYDRGKALRLTQQFLDEQRVESIPVFNVLNPGFYQEALFYVYDGHLTEFGNARVVERIRDYLLHDFHLADQMTAAH